MAYFEGVFNSEVMSMDTNICAVIPDQSIRTGEKARVLYLLHGYGGNAFSWMRFSNIEQLAAKYQIAVIMPEVGYSYYQDMALGKRYFTYLTQELPRYMANLFPISTKREDNFVIGNSMGGYGALKCVLACPERYAAGAGLGAVADIHWALDPVLFNFDPQTGAYAGYEERLCEASAIYGKEPKIQTEQDLYALGESASKSAYRPKVISICGKQDKMFSENEKLANHLEKLPMDFTFLAIEGAHDGDCFQKGLELALELMLEQSEKQE